MQRWQPCAFDDRNVALNRSNWVHRLQLTTEPNRMHEWIGQHWFTPYVYVAQSAMEKKLDEDEAEKTARIRFIILWLLPPDFGAIRSRANDISDMAWRWHIKQPRHARHSQSALKVQPDVMRTPYCLRVKQNIKNHNWIWCIRSCQRPLISIDRRAAARTILRTYERSHTLWDTNNRAAVSWLQTSKYGQNVLLKMTGRSFHRASFSLLASPLRASPFQLAFERVMWRFSSRWLGNLIVAMDIILK